jgi:large repetitive protein
MLPRLSPALVLVLGLAALALPVVGREVVADPVSTPVCQETTVTLRAQADAWLDAGSPSANKGSDSILAVRAATPDKNARAAVRFAAPPAPAPGCVIELARLRLFAASGDATARLEVTRIGSAWAEGSVTWANLPARTGPAATAWGGDGQVQWNVSSLVVGAPAHGFLIRDTAEGDENGGEHTFHSREKGESPPELVIRYAAPAAAQPPPPAPPAPAAVRCGQVVTQSVRLTGGLSNCSGNGIVIGNDRIVVDLGGHTVDGVGLGSGIHNDGFDSVTVRNGTVRQFDHGVQLLPETDAGVVESLTLRENEVAAVELTDAGEPGAGNEIRANLVEQNCDGIALVRGTAATLVTGNTVRDNSGPGLLVAQSDGNRLEGNEVSGSGDLGVGLEQASDNLVLGNRVSGNSDGGIEILGGANGNRVEGNTVSASGDTGILVSESEGNELVGNVSHEMSDSGIGLDAAHGSVVRGNDVRFNPGGIELNGSSGNLVEANRASETSGVGIGLGPDSVQNRIVANEARSNGAQGIYVADEAPAGQGNLIQGNLAAGNSSDGIVTAKGGHTLALNTAEDNGGWGIHAAPGTIDGRGNVARRNGSGQCSGVVCNADVTPPDTVLDEAPDDESATRTASFSFSGLDGGAPVAGLRFECSLDGGPFAACESPKLYEDLPEGARRFEVRAVDAAGNRDPSPALHAWTIDEPDAEPEPEPEPDDLTPPETALGERPPATGTSRSASFTFSGSDDRTPAVELAFECRLDDAAAGYVPCSSPALHADLALGAHSFDVRAVDLAGNRDPSPERHTWTVTAPPACAASTVTLGAAADGWVLQSSAGSGYGADSVLKVDSKSGANARALVRFALPAIPAGCRVTAAQLRLYAASHKAGRTLQALRITASWTETALTWRTQPAAGGAPATAASAGGYVQWSVTAQVQAMYQDGNHGFLVRDAAENGSGVEQGFNSREKGASNPPRLVVSFGP